MYMFTSENDELKGVVSLRDIIFSDPDEKIADFMRTPVIKAYIQDDQEMVAQMIAKYNLLALPVVEDDNKLKGIITVDDVVNIISADNWKKRVPKILGH